jgi:hypothetical protein
MKTLTVKPVPVPEKYKHPDPPNDALMRHEFTLGLIGKFIFYDYCFLYE